MALNHSPVAFLLKNDKKTFLHEYLSWTCKTALRAKRFETRTFRFDSIQVLALLSSKLQHRIWIPQFLASEREGRIFFIRINSTARAVLTGAWVGHGPPDFWLAPCLAPPSFFPNFTFKFVWLTYTADNFQSVKFKRFEDFLATVLTIFTSLCWVW